MDTAFQSDAFQLDAFQIALVPPVVDDGAGAGGKRTSRQSPREPTVYVPLTQRDIESIYPPVRVQLVVTPTLAPVTATTQAKTLDPALVLALFAAFDEDMT